MPAVTSYLCNAILFRCAFSDMNTPRKRLAISTTALALTASGGVAFLTAAGPAAAVAPKAAPVPSDGYSLSISVSQTSIKAGESDTVSGVLTKAGVPQAGDTVYLRARADGRPHRAHRAGSATTGADGSVSFTVTPRRTTHYRLVFRNTSSTPTPTPSPTPTNQRSTAGARSKVATVHVLQATSLSIRAQATRRGEAIQGRLVSHGHGLPGRKVMLQERAAGSDTWTTVATKRTRRHGVVVFRVAAPSAPEEFQLVFAGGQNFAGSQSGVVSVGS